MHVRSLSTREDFERFVDFAEDVYRDNPFWVPTDKTHLMHVLAGEAGFGPGSKVQSFWVEEGDRILARVVALNDEAYDSHWQERMGHLVFFEALPDQDLAVDSLFNDAHSPGPVNLALAAKSYLAMIDRGYRTGSYTVVLDDNWASRHTAEKLGGRVTRNFNIYRKRFDR